MPFLLSAVLIAVGLYIRLGVLETPVFEEMKAKKQVAKAPVLDAVRLYWKDILLTCLIRTGQQAPFVLFTTYLLSYGTGVLKLERSFLFNCVLAAAATSLITTPLFGYLSDRIGRKRMYLIGAFTMLVFAFPYYWLINSAIPAVIALTVVASLVVHDMQYGPQAAFIAESFPPNVRYSGASIGYQLASLTSGGPAPIIATWLMHTYGTSTAISCYLAIIAAISLISAALLKDRSQEDYISVAPRAPDLDAGQPLVASSAKPTLS
nr:MFS transporter [Methylobacterium phyllosphaerae]